MFPKLTNKAVLSPMAGVTDVAFRTLAKQYGAALTYTEFVSSAALVRNNRTSQRMVVTDPSEKPVAVQLFGNNMEEVVQAAQLVEDKFDIIDVNCGCPAWKVIKTGAGSELLKSPERIAKFVNTLASSISKPVTVKIRTGIDQNSINAVEIAKTVEDAGAQALAIHGRTQKQGYSGKADWSIIKEVKQAINIPVIGNGDVTSPEIFQQRIEETGVDYIMIARAAMNNPYIFQQINDYLKKGSYTTPTTQEKISHYMQYLNLAKPHDIPFSVIKQHAMSFTKGIEGGAKLRGDLMQYHTIEEIQDYLQSLN